MTKILITGATGFIGKSTYHYLKQEGYNVIGTCRSKEKAKKLEIDNFIELDLKNGDIEGVLKECDPDIVIHLAALSNPTYGGTSNDFMNVNVLATKRICESIPGKKIVFASSVVVYGDQFNCTEHSTLLKPTTLYGATKAASENIISAYHKTIDLKYVNLRLCSVVGPGLTHGAVMDIREKVKNKECVLFGSKPGSSKPFLHIYDVVRFIETILPAKYKKEIYNVCSDDNITINQIKEIFDPENKCKVIWDKTKVWKGDNRIISCDNSKMSSIYRLFYPTSRSVIESLITEEK